MTDFSKLPAHALNKQDSLLYTLKYFAKSHSQRALTKEIVVPFNNTDIPVYPAGVKFEQDSPGRVKFKHSQVHQTDMTLNVLILSSRISQGRDPVHVQGGLLVSWTCGPMGSADSTQSIHSWSIRDISHNLPTGTEQPRSPCLASVTPRVGLLSPSSNANIYINW